VTGQTSSTNFPTTNAFQTTYGGGAFDAFVTKINTNATALAYSSYLGGSGDDRAFGIAAGGLGSAAVVGQTNSTDFPTTSDALQSAGNGATSAFVMGLASGATGPGLLGYSTYLQGASGGGTTIAAAVAKDGQSNIVVVGQTDATDLPGAAGTQQASNAGATDAFLSKFITTPTCPSGEDCVDIGAPALSGDQLQSGSRATGTWAVTGSGADIFGTADQFHYVAQDAAGDGSISARILSQTNTGQFAKAGLMYRASEDPAAPYYDVARTRLLSPSVREGAVDHDDRPQCPRQGRAAGGGQTGRGQAEYHDLERDMQGRGYRYRRFGRHERAPDQGRQQRRAHAQNDRHRHVTSCMESPIAQRRQGAQLQKEAQRQVSGLERHYHVHNPFNSIKNSAAV